MLVSGLRLHAKYPAVTVCCVTNLYKVLCMNSLLVNSFKLSHVCIVSTLRLDVNGPVATVCCVYIVLCLKHKK